MSLHERRPKHRRHMRDAAHEVEHAMFLQEINPLRGIDYLRSAIALVVDCGCSRELWPDDVKKAIPAS